MPNITIYEQQCPYCKEKFAVSLTNNNKESKIAYEEHLKTCKEFEKRKEENKKTVELYFELKKKGLSHKDIQLLFSNDDIEKDIMKLMKKYKVDKEELIDIIESIN